MSTSKTPRPLRFRWVDEWTKHSELSSRARHALLALNNYMDPNGTCFPSVKRLARDMGTSDRTVQRGLKEAESAGWLARERGSGVRTPSGRTVLYRAIIKDVAASEGVTPVTVKG